MAAVSRPTRNSVIVMIASAVVVIVIVIAVAIGLSLGSGPAVEPGITSSAGTPSPSGSSSGTPTGDATVAPGGEATNDPQFGEPVADSVPHDGVAQFGDQVTAALGGIVPFTATGAGIGEVSGPAVRVTVTITNGSSAAISLDAVTVNAYSGADATPAAPLSSDGSSAPFTGSLAPGATASGVYAFSIADGTSDSVVVTVSRGAGSPLVVFGR